MKFCIIGAGAIGGLLAVRLSEAGHEASVVARGAQLEAIRANGLTLIESDGSRKTARLPADRSLDSFGPQDCVILAVKAHQVADVAPALAATPHRDAMVMTAQNGIPWWYFSGAGGPYEGRALESVDPGGRIASHLPASRLIGSVVYPAAEIVEPGVVKHIEGLRFSLGELDGKETPRLRALSEALGRAGFKAPVAADLRAEIWTKLWGNMSFNPISALTHATLEEICRFPATRALAAQMMRETQTIAEKLGIRFRTSIDKRISGAEAVGAHKTSMLQDVESGRPLESKALIGAVLELAEMTATPAPATAAVGACLELLGATLSTRGGRLRVDPL